MKTYIEFFATDRVRNMSASFDSATPEDKLRFLVHQCFYLHYTEKIYGSLNIWTGFTEFKEKLKYYFSIYNKQIKNKNLRDPKIHKNFYSFAESYINVILSKENDDFGEKDKSVLALFEGVKYLGLFSEAYFGDYKGEFPDKTESDLYYEDVCLRRAVVVFITHLANIHGYNTAVDEADEFIKNEGYILIPWNITSPNPLFKTLRCEYQFNEETLKSYRELIGPRIHFLPSLLVNLKTIEKTDNLMDNIFTILSSCVLSPNFIGSFVKYENRINVHNNFFKYTKKAEVIIYELCFKAFCKDMLYGRIFQFINNPINEFTKTVESEEHYMLNHNFFKWFISSLSENYRLKNVDFFRSLVFLFNRSIKSPSEADSIIKILYKFPDLTVEEKNLLLKNNFDLLASKMNTKFFFESDEEPSGGTDEEGTEEEVENDPEEDESDGSEDPEDENFDDDGGDEFDDSSDFGSDDSSGGESSEGGGSGSEPEVNSVKTLFGISGKTDLSDILYRFELDRKITKLLKMQAYLPELTGEDVKILKSLQSHWLYLSNKTILNILIEDFKRRQLL